ncbi:MAG: alpha/beta hydrolase [Actinomycetota bacterium]|nr:alpha/beta hydrolase [Actinomycetota bacterium]
MTETTTRVDFPSEGGVTIAAYRWDPDGEPRAIVQLAHGMGEYALRYAPLAERLTAEGYVVYTPDHRGHGDTASSPEAYGVLGETGWADLVDDVGRMSALATDAHPGLPLALVAHSMGSFAAQQYLLDHSGDVSAVVLSGTAAIDLLEPGMDLEQPMDLSAFNAPFQPQRTDFDWLSRDEAQVDAYIADPRCGFGLDVAGGKAMFATARQVADPARVAAMRRDLPVYVVVGSMDPVNGGLALVNELVRRYEDAGLEDVTLVVYPDARHEVFNETNREEVVAGLMAWLDEKIG